ncbi:hypothetical protein F4679DRAFT_582345 [Xylaria curta]|nr:hypothetical protein F4679DRAFT_582345 [Xylaria curta]
MESIPKETALSIILSSRSYGDPIKCTPTTKVERKSFREIFCASLQPQTTSTPSETTIPIETSTPSETQGISTKDVDTQTHRSTEPVLPIAPEDPVRNLEHSTEGSTNVDYDPQTSYRTRHYETQPLYRPRGLDRPRGFDQTRAFNQINYPRMITDKRMRKQFEQFQQGKGRYHHKKEKNPHWVQDECKEPQPEPRRLNFDWDEFNREVEENNLKTLKDSRWAC